MARRPTTGLAETLALVALIAIIAVVGAEIALYFFLRDTGPDGRLFSGAIIVTDQGITYSGGEPTRYSKDQITNGCHWRYVPVGQPVYLRDAHGRTVATGRITETFHWENGGSSLAASRDNHACAFRYEIPHVPVRDSYDLSVGFLIQRRDITQADLRHFDASGDYPEMWLLPLIQFEYANK
jgi:hypothetical protein